MKEKRIENFENIKQIIENSARKYGDRNAFIIKHKKDKKVTYQNITFKDFKNDIDSLGTALISMGLKDKRIAVIGKNRYEWAVSYYAVVNGAGIVVPLDKGLPKQEIEDSLIRSKAEVIIFSKEYEEIIEEILEKHTKQLKTCITMDETKNDKFIEYSKVLKTGKKRLQDGDTSFLHLKIDNEKMSIILFTSGTTSMAKAVMLSHKNIASNINALLEKIDIYPTDVNMAFLPFHHTFGSTGLLFFLSKGACTVFCDGLRHIAENLKEYKVSVFFCVPLILEAMYKKVMQAVEKQGKTKQIRMALAISNFLRCFGIDIRRKIFKQIIDQLGGNIRLIISGAAAIDKKVAKGFNDFGILAIQGYGLTETSPVISAENEKNIRWGSIGKKVFNVDVKIDNPNEDGIGEIVVKGPNVMLGYYENEEETKKVLKDGWFYTGDLAYQDKDGYIFITGRKKNVIVLKNGKNVYPEELELLISSLPYVKENIVVGVPRGDDYDLKAKIVYNEDYVEQVWNTKDEKEIRERVWEDIKNINKTLTNYKHIKDVIVTNQEMVKTTTNKIKRSEEKIS